MNSKKSEFIGPFLYILAVLSFGQLNSLTTELITFHMSKRSPFLVRHTDHHMQ